MQAMRLLAEGQPLETILQALCLSLETATQEAVG
jgi:hypothetical protein